MAAKKKPASRASGAVKKGVRAAKGAAKGAVKSAKGAVKSAKGAVSSARAKATAAPPPPPARAAKPADPAGAAEKPAGALARLKTGVTSLIGRLTGRGKPAAAPGEELEDAIADAPYDVSGVHKVSDQLARAQRGRGEDDVQLPDPSVVVDREARGRRATTIDDPEESGSMSLFEEPPPSRGSKQRLEKIAAIGRRRQAEAAAAVKQERGLFDGPDDD
jgi:hypothetical protein